MKYYYVITLLLLASLCNATDYFSISNSAWSNTDGGADCTCAPSALTTGDNVTAKHVISTTISSLTGTPNITVTAAGSWTLTGGDLNINAGNWTIDLGGQITLGAGNLTTSAAAVIAVNGSLTAIGAFTNDIAITGSGTLYANSAIGGVGSFTGNTPLPVELTEFSAEKTDDGTVLHWSTASEIKSDYFEIQQSVDGITYNFLGRIDAGGSSAAFRNYQFCAGEAVNAVQFYRLIEVDVDGNTQIFAPLVLNGAAALQLTASLFPNPCVDHIQLRFNAAKSGPYLMNLYNVQNGQWLNSITLNAVRGENTFAIELSDFNDSAFMLTMSSNEVLVATAHFVKK